MPHPPASTPAPRRRPRADPGRRLPVARRLEGAALELFATRGYDATTVDDLAAAGGVGRRTFFRYFPTKLDVVLGQLDDQRHALAAALEDSADADPVASARHAFLAVNRYAADELPALRRRLQLLADVPDLEARAAARYRDWERLLASDAARRWGVPVTSLRPQVLGRAEVAAMRGVFAVWLVSPGAALDDLVTTAFDDLAAGFAT